MNTTTENIKGTLKETAGELTGNESLENEGEQQQKKAHAAEEAGELQDAADKKAKEAAGHAGAEAKASDS